METFFEKVHGLFPHFFRSHDFLYKLINLFTGMVSIDSVEDSLFMEKCQVKIEQFLADLTKFDRLRWKYSTTNVSKKHKYGID